MDCLPDANAAEEYRLRFAADYNLGFTTYRINTCNIDSRLLEISSRMLAGSKMNVKTAACKFLRVKYDFGLMDFLCLPF
jgi:hypothetical protein